MLIRHLLLLFQIDRRTTTNCNRLEGYKMIAFTPAPRVEFLKPIKNEIVVVSLSPSLFLGVVIMHKP
jgi:DNA polymerase III sliding clamp (beta) subunit (PCNA family)